jgi:DNA-directed RNA polymerase beta' subunit
MSTGLNIPYGEISAITFYPRGDQENMMDNSKRTIMSAELTKQGIPVTGGVQDLKLGTTTDAFVCLSCGNRMDKCPGHSGMYKLNYPVYSPLFIGEIFKWLKVVCFGCSNLLLDKDMRRVRPDLRLSELAKLTKVLPGTPCRNCGEIRHDINRPVTDPTQFNMIIRGGGDMNKIQPIYPHTVGIILSKIKDSTVEALGKNALCHPRKYVLNLITIPPNTIRPDTKAGPTGRLSNNDLTLFYKKLIEANQKIDDGLISTPNTDEGRAKLQKNAENIVALNNIYYGLILKSEKYGIEVGRNKRVVLTDITKRWRGKTGRIRRNLMGRRAIHISRSFITCDNSLKYYQVGVPLQTAREQSIKVVVREYNFKECQTYYNNCTTHYPGAKYVYVGDTRFIIRHRLDNRQPLTIGMTIERDIITGDVVAFNRQPSLEPSAVSCMQAVVFETGNTFRMNVSVCVLFGADFDGDAMNMLWPRCLSTANEIWHQSYPGQFFINYKRGEPTMGEVQDAIMGLGTLTREAAWISRYHAMQLFCDFPLKITSLVKAEASASRPGDLDSWGQPLIPGRDVISAFMQHLNYNISYTGKPTMHNKNYAEFGMHYDPKDILIVIDKGKLVQGVLDKASVGQGSMGGLFHIVNNQRGSMAALDMAHYMQLIGIRHLMQSGITVGIRDILIDDEAMALIHREEAVIIEKSKDITRRLNEGKMISPIGMTKTQYYEALQMAALDHGDDFYKYIINSIDWDSNNLMRIIGFGAKGAAWNLKNISAAIGQIKYLEARMQEIFNGRCLPYFPRYDDNPESRGYVPNSYLVGLSVASFFYHAMESRIAIVNRALTTARTGHQSRKSIKSLETCITDNLRRLVSELRVVQQLYGGDGLDPRCIERVSFPTMVAKLSTEEFKKEFGARSDQFAKIARGPELDKLLEEELAQLLLDRDHYRSIYIRLNMNGSMATYDSQSMLPVNMKRIIETVQFDLGLHKLNRADNGKTSTETFNPVEAILMIRQYCADLPYVLYNRGMKERRVPLPEYARRSTELLAIHIRSHLNCANMLKLHITMQALELILDAALVNYSRALIAPGRAMGIIAAQSLSEPQTQMVLNSHHSVGGGTGGKRSGLQKIYEIMGVQSTHNQKKKKAGVNTSPELAQKGVSSMTLHTVPSIMFDRMQVQQVANQIEMLLLQRFINKTSIFYERYGEPVHPDYVHEAKLIKDFEKYWLLSDGAKKDRVSKPPSDLTQWCIRIELDKFRMIEKRMYMITIVQKLRKMFPKTWIVFTSDNAPELILRIYVRSSYNSGRTLSLDDIRKLRHEIKETVVRGISGVRVATVYERQITVEQPDGSLQTPNMYYISTVGSNLAEVMEHPLIDPKYVQSDSIPEMEQMFGIAVARAKLTDELKQIIPKCSFRHYTVYADEMSFHGTVTAISNFGSARREASPLLQISDEQPTKAITNSTINCVTDHLAGISAPILMGKTPKNGDTYNRYIFNKEMAQSHLKDINSILTELK